MMFPFTYRWYIKLNINFVYTPLPWHPTAFAWCMGTDPLVRRVIVVLPRKEAVAGIHIICDTTLTASHTLKVYYMFLIVSGC